MSTNIFIDYHEKVNGSLEDRVGSGWEDFFTEMLYFYLCCDREVLEDLCKTVLRGDFERPVKLETQFQQGGARPDLVIHLESGRLLILEHKVEQGLRLGQLDDYLKIVGKGGKPCVALFSARTQHIPAQVLADSRYKKPAESGDHYHWQEVYQLIRARALDSLGTDNLRTFFLDYMALLGFAPSALTEKWRRLLEDRLIPENRDVQEEFGRRLAGARSFLKNAVGFKVSKVSHKGCIGEPLSKRPYCRLVIEPRRARAQHLSSAGAKHIKPDVLSVFLVYDNGEPPPHAQAFAGNFPDPFEDSLGNKWFPMKPYTMTSGRRTRLEFVANLESFLSEPDSEIQNRLTTACTEVIKKILKLDRDAGRNTTTVVKP